MTPSMLIFWNTTEWKRSRSEAKKTSEIYRVPIFAGIFLLKKIRSKNIINFIIITYILILKSPQKFEPYQRAFWPPTVPYFVSEEIFFVENQHRFKHQLANIICNYTVRPFEASEKVMWLCVKTTPLYIEFHADF